MTTYSPKYRGPGPAAFRVMEPNPSPVEPQTEDQINRQVNSMIEAMDRAVRRGSLTQEQYDYVLVYLEEWADHQYQIIARAR